MEPAKYTRLHRLLHWSIALAMPVMFITGFLRMYWMNKNNLVKIIETEAGTALSADQMAGIATSIRAPMWEWHERFAWVMIIAVGVRITYMVAKGIRFPNPFRSRMLLKERLQGFTYVYFYFFVLVSAFTGVCLQQKFLTQWEDPIEAIHKWGLYWFPIFIVLHAAGIILAEYSHQKGISSRMISGD